MADPARLRRLPSSVVWIGVLALVLVLALLQVRFPQLHAYPKEWQLPLTDWLNVAMDGIVAQTKQCRILRNMAF